MSFTTISARRALDRRLWILIQGVEQVLVESTISPTSVVSSRTQLEVVTDVVFGEAEIDFASRAERGGSLTVVLRDTTSHALRALFASRSREATFITSSIAKGTAMSGSGTINVSSSSSLASTGTVIIGGETFTYGGKTSTTLTSVTRAKYDSRAQDHLGGSTRGARVWTVPPTWAGRRVKLYMGFIAPDATSETILSSDTGLLGTFRLDTHPQPIGADQWRLVCGSLADTYAATRYFVGQREAVPAPEQTPFELELTSNGGSIDVSTENAFLFKTGGATTHVLARYVDGKTQIHPLYSVSSATIEFRLSTEVERDDSVRNNFVFGVTSLRHIAIMRGDPSTITLRILLSMLGDGTNSATYDVLPGALRATYGGEEWRFGAGLDAADVSSSAFAAFAGQGPAWTYSLDEEGTVGDLLTEFCRSVGAFWSINPSGQITVARLRDRGSSTASVSITADDVTADDVEGLSVQQGPAIHSARIRANWDPLQRSYLFNESIVDHEIRSLYPEDAGEFAMTSRMLTIEGVAFRGTPEQGERLKRANAMSFDASLVMLRREMIGSLRARVIVQLRLSWLYAPVLALGDIVDVSNARLPDMSGSTLSTTPCLVIKRGLDLEQGVVMLSMLMLEKIARIAPTGIVTAWNGGTKTLTLSNTDDTGASPGDYFSVGGTVRIWDSSGLAFENEVIASVTATTIVLVAAPSGFTPAAGDLVFPVAEADIADSASGFGPDDYAYQVPTAGTLGVTDVTDPRWS